MFQHFGNRLKRDLKQLVDRRLDSSALSSGSSMKVGLSRMIGSSAHLHPRSHLVLKLKLSHTSDNGMLGNLIWHDDHLTLSVQICRLVRRLVTCFSG